MTCPAAHHGSGDPRAAAFARVFGVAPEVTASARGRVNLLGEHTDYNDGFVLPMLVHCATRVQAARGEGIIDVYAEQFDERRRGSAESSPDRTWLDYVTGCVRVLAADGMQVPGARLYVHRGVPPGAGLASSAALEVAVLRALRELYGLALDDVHLARMAHRAEVEHVGVRCGVMDQMVAALGSPGHAMLLDTRSLRHASIRVPEHACFMVIDSAIPRRLADAAYNRRRTECEAAAARLGVRALRDLGVDDLGRVASLPEPLDRRARHVVTENARVLEGVDALRAGHLRAFGRLMIDSHRSLRDDYDVSLPELDRLVEEAMTHGALGARLTGAGFGGCVVVLHEQEDGRAIAAGVLAAAPAATFHAVLM